MLHFTIQSAGLGEAEAICKISKKVLNTELSRDEIKRLFEEIFEDVEQIIMTAINSAHTVGFVHARRVKDFVRGSYTEIVSIGIYPYYQKQGAGTSLLLGVEQWSRQMLTPELKCIPPRDNEGMRRLLTGCGYVENGQGIFEKSIV